MKKIKRAIISVSDKSNLKLILSTLKKFDVQIISSGGSYKKIKDMKHNCIEVSNYTGSSEMLNGRVKTLHPKIHAGILNIRKNKEHQRDLLNQNIPNIDLVIVNLYPFEKKFGEKIKFEKLIEYIDIGGLTLLRSAAKNFNDVTVISSVADYPKLTKELKANKGATSTNFRKLMAAKAFSLTAYYDSVISNWLNNQLDIKFPEKKTIYGKIVEKLRYGENPHQQGSLYATTDNLDLRKLQGNDLSYNNYNDIYSALSILGSLKQNEGAAIIKHTSPCGVSSEKNQLKSFKNALMCDPVSAYGGVVAINSIISVKLARELNKIFFDVILSRGFESNALKILKKRKKTRLIDFSKFNLTNKKHYLFLGNSFLAQDSDNILFKKKIENSYKKKTIIKSTQEFKICI